MIKDVKIRVKRKCQNVYYFCSIIRCEEDGLGGEALMRFFIFFIG
jgi:hypothetical protein